MQVSLHIIVNSIYRQVINFASISMEPFNMFFYSSYQAVNTAAQTNDPSFGPSHSLPLEEDLQLRLAFVIPEDSYSCDSTKGIPNGFQEFLDPLGRAGECRD